MDRNEAVEIFVSARLVHLDTIAVGVHSAKFPEGSWHTPLGSIFKLKNRLLGDDIRPWSPRINSLSELSSFGSVADLQRSKRLVTAGGLRAVEAHGW